MADLTPPFPAWAFGQMAGPLAEMRRWGMSDLVNSEHVLLSGANLQEQDMGYGTKFYCGIGLEVGCLVAATMKPSKENGLRCG